MALSFLSCDVCAAASSTLSRTAALVPRAGELISKSRSSYDIVGQYQIPGIDTANTRFWSGGIEYWVQYHLILMLDTATWPLGLEVSLHSCNICRSSTLVPELENSFPRDLYKAASINMLLFLSKI